MYLETLCQKRFVSEKLELFILIGMLVPFGFLGITYRSSFYPHTEEGGGGGGREGRLTDPDYKIAVSM